MDILAKGLSMQNLWRPTDSSEVCSFSYIEEEKEKKVGEIPFYC